MAVEAQTKAKDSKKLSVFISYNGMNESFDYSPEQAAESIRQRALNHYDIRGADREQNFLAVLRNEADLHPSGADDHNVVAELPFVKESCPPCIGSGHRSPS